MKLWIAFFSQVFSNFPIIFNEMTCFMILVGIFVRFKKFNEILRKSEEISNFPILFFKLLEIVENYNESFLFAIAVFGSSHIASFLAQLFIIYLSITGNSFELQKNISLSILLNFMTVFRTILFVAFCCFVKSEFDETKEILEKKILKVKNEREKKKLKIFALQLKHTEIKFSCGLFEFDWRTLTMVSLLTLTKG
jgi:hypothetical protein